MCQGALEGPPLPITTPVGLDLQVSALLDGLDGSVARLEIRAVGCVEGLEASLYLEPLWDVGPADVYLGGGGEAHGRGLLIVSREVSGSVMKVSIAVE